MSFITGKGTPRETTTTQNSPRRPSNEGYTKDKLTIQHDDMSHSSSTDFTQRRNRWS